MARFTDAASGPQPGVAAAPTGLRFGLAPSPLASGRPRAYFMLAVPAGHSAAATAVVSDDGPAKETLRISRATGGTAPNGGSVFGGHTRRCAGTACWLSGLPHTVVLSPGAQQQLPFTVAVPAGTPRGQYLAGIAAELASPPRSVVVGSNGKASARAIIIDQVVVGVAVTVGPLSALTSRLQIATVSGEYVGQTPRFQILLRNTGQTFASGTGSVSCDADGRRLRFPVYADTVLPHEQAAIAANAPGISGTVHCAVRLRYGAHRSASWSGAVVMPAATHPRIIHTGNGAYSVLPAGGVPGWAIGVMILGVLVLAALVALLLGRRRGALATARGPRRDGRVPPQPRADTRAGGLDRLLGRRDPDAPPDPR